ncbi:MAG: PASTA domain-containing protein [Parabacteroides sp.]
MGNIFVKLIKNPFVITLVLAAALTGGLIWGVLHWLDVYTRHNEAIVVPDIKGLRLEDAVSFLENNHLRYNVVDSVFSKEVAPGAIVEVIPNVGSKVKEGRILFITINALTSQMAAIPEITDLSFRQAYAILKSRGFNEIEVEYVAGEYKDLAIGVEYKERMLPAGELIPLNAKLVLKISGGPDMDSLAIDEMDSLNLKPVEKITNDEENWF